MSTIGQPAQYSSRVNLAAGVVRMQADCRIEQALASMNEWAEDEHVPVEEVAAAVLNHAIRFDDRRAASRRPASV